MTHLTESNDKDFMTMFLAMSICMAAVVLLRASILSRTLTSKAACSPSVFGQQGRSDRFPVNRWTNFLLPIEPKMGADDK